MAESVLMDKDVLSKEVSELRLREQHTAKEVEDTREQVALLSAKVAELEKKEIQLVSAAEIANAKVKELQLQVHTALVNEAAARKEIAVAHSKLEDLAAKYASLEASLSGAVSARTDANMRVREVVAQVRILFACLAFTGTVTLTQQNMLSFHCQIKSAALEQMDQATLEIQFAELTKKEAAATAAAVQAQERFEFLLRYVSSVFLFPS